MYACIPVYLCLFALAFLLGSIPWGLVISRCFFHKDIRQEGSGNIGTTNALRSMGKAGGAAVFLLDFGKGLLSGGLACAFAALLAGNLPGFEGAAMLENAGELYAAQRLCLGVAFLACVWGHIFSPWLKFKGGKGIAVAVGCLFVVFGPVGALLELALFGVLVAATRYVSVGSLAAAITCPLFALWYFHDMWPVWLLIMLAAITVIWAHRGNIARLRAGTERRLGSKKHAPTSSSESQTKGDNA